MLCCRHVIVYIRASRERLAYKYIKYKATSSTIVELQTFVAWNNLVAGREATWFHNNLDMGKGT